MDYRIYSSEGLGSSFNFRFSKGDAIRGRHSSREVLIKYIKKTSKYFQLVSLMKQ